MLSRIILSSVGIAVFSLSSIAVSEESQLNAQPGEIQGFLVGSQKIDVQYPDSPVTGTDSNLLVAPSDLFYPSLVSELYQQINGQSVWSNSEVNAQFHLQLDMMRLAGFSPVFEQRVDKLEHLFQQQDFATYDQIMTDTVLLYMSYVGSVVDGGKEWFFTHRLNEQLPPPSQTEIDLLVAAVNQDHILEFVQSLASPMIMQPGFDQVYVDLLAKSQLPVETFHQTGLKRKGDIFDVEQYQALLSRLNESGLLVLENNEWLFDSALDDAVREFQRLYGLKDDGVIGPNTIKWLNRTANDKLQILALNSERSRLWPQQRENIVLVNVPSFQLQYWDSGKARFQSRVIVGKYTRQTPIFVTQMDSIIVNPTWNVPWKIMVKDIIPKVKRDPTYLFSQQIEILEGWHTQERVDPTMIDWSEINAKRFPYRMRQRAGAFNALGQVKFNTPNDRAIFLHDTPSKYLFNQSSRAFSSGCVRVEHAEQFAQVLLKGQGRSVDSMITERSNKSIGFKQRIPVHIIYQTAWLEDGQVHFRNDVYEYDSPKQSVNDAALSKN
ncbi:L,D-transpeptidase family protein [Vibrio hippocampi]|uniref:L,D-transpeptidase YcbB n=1 Tax=Vibrio hippocampi TaxID=654686 RepID=A0ABM8ZG78_9VIBR|nr:L,D-transpeptidase family protein [Vibrio hippocampi]CAH0525602.1 putative L,D-transpeptidase YcbB [Vibrio hippocampi]